MRHTQGPRAGGARLALGRPNPNPTPTPNPYPNLNPNPTSTPTPTPTPNPDPNPNPDPDQVCGLRWSPWGTQLASGGNDNLLNIWDDRWQQASSHHSAPHQPHGSCGQPLFRLERHLAAVKAIAWCPWQRNLLASGGGTADRTAAWSDGRLRQCPSSPPTPLQGAPDSSGQLYIPRGGDRGHWALRHCLECSSEPPPKVTDPTAVGPRRHDPLLELQLGHVPQRRRHALAGLQP